MEEKMVTTTEAGELLGVTGETVRQWIKDKRLQARRTVGGKYRVFLSSVEKLLGELNQSHTTNNPE